MPRLAGIVVLFLLSGCMGANTGPEPSETRDVTDPADYSYDGTQGHRHNYWRDQERVMLLDEERDSSGRILSCGEASWELFRPEAPATVYQGTARVEVTFTWEDGTGDSYSDPGLWIKTTADANEQFVSDVTNGETVVYASNNTANDLPHNLLSAWEFHWYLAPGHDEDPTCHRSFTGTLSIEVEIVKGLEIPVYPGHPDRWKNQTQILLVDAAPTVFYHEGAPDESSRCLSPRPTDRCLWAPHTPANETVVPADAAGVEVLLSSEDALGLRFTYHPADTWDLAAPEPHETSGNTRTYWIPVERTMGDGPYSRHSLWEFWISPDESTGHYSGSYEISVTVFKEPRSDASY